MRTKFIEVNTRKQALELAPWACAFAKVEGGYHAFESADEYKVWKNQK